ncbi:MAG TPA: aspartyl protease family protein [Steroidobacteraceae bacterium]|nr:aspartyl protease family protein [Steroidobacteraceae bacterium]
MRASDGAARLLRQMYLASGGRAWAALAGAEFSGQCDIGGLTGSFHQIVDFRQGRDVLSYRAGLLRGASGTARARSWWMDEKGLVTVEQTPDALIDAATQSYEDRNGWFHPGPADTPIYRGVQQDGARSFYVVQVHPPGGRPLTLWIDPKTHLLDRVLWIDAYRHPNVQTFSDYRRVGGVVYPFVQRDSSGDPDSDVTTRITGVRLRADLSDRSFGAPPSHVQDARLLTRADFATIPFTLRAGIITVDVSIDGAPALPFMLDSGSSNVLTPQAAARLHLSLRGSVAVDGVGNQQVTAHLTEVPRYRVGEVELSNQRFVVLPLPPELLDRDHSPPIAGLLGYELLRRFIVRVDYQRGQLTLWRSTREPGSAAGVKVPLEFDERDCFVTAEVDGDAGLFRVDTGDDGALTLLGDFYLGHRVPIELPGLRSSQGGVGGSVRTLLTRVQSLSIGPFTLDRPLTELHFASAGAFASAQIAGNLGAQIFRNFVLTFDYPHHALYLRKSPQFGAQVPYNRSGLLLDAGADGGLVVAAVDDASPAAEAGLRLRDRLLAVDGRAVRSRDFAQVTRQLSRPAGTQLMLDVLRRGAHLRLQLTLQELLPLEGELYAPPRRVGFLSPSL